MDGEGVLRKGVGTTAVVQIKENLDHIWSNIMHFLSTRPIWDISNAHFRASLSADRAILIQSAQCLFDEVPFAVSHVARVDKTICRGQQFKKCSQTINPRKNSQIWVSYHWGTNGGPFHLCPHPHPMEARLCDVLCHLKTERGQTTSHLCLLVQSADSGVCSRASYVVAWDGEVTCVRLTFGTKNMPFLLVQGRGVLFMPTWGILMIDWHNSHQIMPSGHHRHPFQTKLVASSPFDYHLLK